MGCKIKLPSPEVDRVNRWFQYETEYIGPNNGPLIRGFWISLYVGDIFGDNELGGDIQLLRQLFCHGIDTLADRLADCTDVKGVFGETKMAEIILRRFGFCVDTAGDFGRVAYMPRAKLLEKPWQRKEVIGARSRHV